MESDAVISKITIIKGDITKLRDKEGNYLDAKVIVNAAKPTLMGGRGVDGSIHKAVNKNLMGITFKEIIKKELDKEECYDEDRIRCAHGDVVTTKGYELSKYIIHAVGPKWDGGSKSCIDTLKNTYEKIFEEFVKLDVSTIAIPIISSGSYGFPFELASKVQMATIFNCLLKLKNKNLEVYNRIEKVYLVVFETVMFEEYIKIYSNYEESMLRERQLLILKSKESNDAYFKEIKEYDSKKRNYFGITRILRLFLSKSDYIFFISYILKKIFADKDWHSRRMFIEIEVIFKTILSFVFLFIPLFYIKFRVVLTIIAVYFMMETIVYISKFGSVNNFSQK